MRQHEVPPGKHALIHVKQPRGQLVAVRARPATQAEPPPRELRLWQDCDVVQVRKATAKIGLAVINSRARDREKGSDGGGAKQRDQSAKQPPLHSDLTPTAEISLSIAVLLPRSENRGLKCVRKNVKKCEYRTSP